MIILEDIFTYEIKENDKIIPVDLGFIVFNELTYPNLIKFFKELKVPFEKSNMSFSVSVKKIPILNTVVTGSMEYLQTNLIYLI